MNFGYSSNEVSKKLILKSGMKICTLTERDLNLNFHKKINNKNCEIILVKSKKPSLKLKNYLRTLVIKKNHAPIILHVDQSTSEERTNYLKIGIEDCLSGKICCEELFLKLKKFSENKTNENHSKSVFFYKNFMFFFKSKRAIYRKKEIILNKKETLLLECLLKKENITVPRTLLYASAWKTDDQPNSNSLETHMCSLRKKIKQKTGFNLIKTVCGVGYIVKTKTPAFNGGFKF